jgi:hypothetical protein
MVRVVMNLNKLVVEPVSMWAKRQAVGNAPRCPRVGAVPRRGMVHMSTGCAPIPVGCAPFQLFTMGKELGWRDVDRLWPVFAHQTYHTEFSPIPVPSVN